MVKEGALENPRPLAIFGLHTTPETEAGKIGYRAGPAQAAFDVFTLTIRGKTAYAAWPHKGVDTMLVAAECIMAVQSIKSRRIDTFEPVIITIGSPGCRVCTAASSSAPPIDGIRMSESTSA